MRLTAASMSLLLALALFGSGCGDDDTTCGTGTHDEGGVCVPDKAKSDSGVKDGGGGGGDGPTGPHACGNDKLEGNEACDDGNKNDNDACLSTCKKNTCGDGHIYYGKEECDDANTDNTDVCISNCRLARCGDTYVWKGVEDCDDGNTKDGDKCPATCKKTFTGLPGKVIGKVSLFGLDSSAGISVSLGGSTYTTKTDATGAFTLSSVKTGIYDLTASYSLYQSATFKNITVIPNATFTVPDQILLRAEKVDHNVKWAGLGDGDKNMAWIDIANNLLQRSTTANSKSTIVGTAVKSAKLINGKKHLLHLDTLGDMYITALGGTTPVKVASKVSSYWFAKTDGWLLVRTTKDTLYFISPDGKTIHKVTEAYNKHLSFTKSKHILVHADEGFYSLPAAGGKPITLDADKNLSYCGTTISDSTTACKGTNAVGFSYDQNFVFYFVKTQGKNKAEARSVDITTGKTAKLVTLDWPVSSMKATMSRFGTKEHVLVTDSGTKSGYNWRRFRTVPMAGGKVVSIPDMWAYSSNTWYGNIVLAPDGSGVLMDTYQYNSSNHRYVKLYPTDGTSSKTVYSNARYVRYLKYSPDGKRIIYVVRPYSSSNYRLASVSNKGTNNQTHVSNMGSYYNNWTYMPLATELLYSARMSSSSYKVQRVKYSSSSPSTLATCTSSASLTKVSNSAALFRCNSSSTYTYYLYRSSPGSVKSLISGKTVSYSLAPDKKAVLLWAYSSGGYNYTLADTSSGATTSVAQNQSTTYAINWVKIASGSYNFYLRPGSSSQDRTVLCGITKSLAVKPLGKTKYTPTNITTKAGDRYIVFVDTYGASATLIVSGIDGCTQVKAHTGATTYGSKYLTPDEKSVVFLADGSVHIIALAGGKSKVLVKQGKYKFMLDKHLFYTDYASSPKGTFAAVLAVPLAGGSAVPVDYSMGSTWKGKSDLLYSYGGLKYLDM